MILPFSTQMQGKPNYFIEKIWEGLLKNNFPTDAEYVDFMSQHKSKFNKNWDWFPEEHTKMKSPKIHTIREDKNERWKAGNKIDFFINCRQKNMFRFAPVLPVVSVQDIAIIYNKVFRRTIYPEIFIDGARLNPMRLEELAYNDGFDSIAGFFAYFKEDFVGKLINWTDFRY